ncbi:hypothetical protein HN415_09530 [Candidatus Woesearchaeota archaeon]|jgi:hypothetical protein|nr:hypothetical protein [Candidatus Woesearchaeota archaeon]
MINGKNQNSKTFLHFNKKSMIEIQFNWIFILIVGVLILLFFIGLTNWYKENEMRENSNNVKFMLQTVMTGASINSRTASPIEIPKIEIDFNCDPNECGREGCSSEFTFSKTGVSQDTSMDIIFSPKKIESDFMYVWSLDWNEPYKVSNFLYLSSPALKYYLVYKDGYPNSKKLAEKVFSKMSDNTLIKMKLIEDDEFEHIKYNNEYLVRLIRFYEGPGENFGIDASPSMLKEKKWDVVYITGDEESGTIHYSRWSLTDNKNREKDPNKKTDYVGLSSLIGAIFTEDYDTYLCNMKKAYTKFKTVNEIYSIRSEKLLNTYIGDNKCEFLYGASLQTSFTNIENSLSNVNDIDNSDINVLLNSIEEIKSSNSDTVMKTCPRIY